MADIKDELQDAIEDVKDNAEGIKDGVENAVDEIKGSKKNGSKGSAKDGGDGEEKLDVKKEILSWVVVLGVSMGIAYIISHFIIINARIPSSSMENTIMTGDKVIGSRLSYTFGTPKRGDIAIFYAPERAKTMSGQESHNIYIKRVIGIPGDTIKIENCKLYVNGELQEEDYINTWEATTGEMETVLGDKEYFVMGDNRDHSFDSRAWGIVEEDAFIAKAVIKYRLSPFGISRFKNPNN